MSFNQQNQVFFNLIFFSSQQFFTQHCLLSALNSINIMKHLNCFSITCLISISIVFQSHALLSVTIDFQSQLIFSQHSMISISIVFQSTLIFSQHLYCFKITSVSRASCGASGRAFSGVSGEVCGRRAADGQAAGTGRASGRRAVVRSAGRASGCPARRSGA